MTDRPIRLLELADDYKAACEAMPALWRRVLETYPDSDLRHDAVRSHREGRERCAAARAALLLYAAAGADEIG